MATRRLSVLLTNDDGPPGIESPYVYGLYRHLTKDMGWDVKVVLPSSQKSWIGKAYQIADIIRGRYYYPRDPDGQGEISSQSRALKDGEVAEWILLDATPATCANVALHNLYHGQIDLLISGPNLGRNTSAAFALSSGTIGAALSSSLSAKRSIAVSYGTVHRPTPEEYIEPAHQLAGRIIVHLWENWGEDEGGLRGEVDLYNLNIPMIDGLLRREGLQICWTHIWRNSYGRLFARVGKDNEGRIGEASMPSSGPDSTNTKPGAEVQANIGGDQESAVQNPLVFKFSPDIGKLIAPPLSSIPEGSDGWAMSQGLVSVTPLRASFAEPLSNHAVVLNTVEDRIWKIKL